MSSVEPGDQHPRASLRSSYFVRGMVGPKLVMGMDSTIVAPSLAIFLVISYLFKNPVFFLPWFVLTYLLKKAYAKDPYIKTVWLKYVSQSIVYDPFYHMPRQLGFFSKVGQDLTNERPEGFDKFGI
mgnify:CR=1 FL=1